MLDTKSYGVLNDGTHTLKKSDWDSDSQKLALNADDTPKPNGTGLIVFTEGQYENGCEYGFCSGGHWYLY